MKDQHLIKNPWEYQDHEKILHKEGRVSSRTELLQKRKLDRIPDKSYDLDGDGFVGGRDYVISKRYDIDRDGKLDEKEKKMALDAISKNVEDDYVWNLENQGVIRPCRILQKVKHS